MRRTHFKSMTLFVLALLVAPALGEEPPATPAADPLKPAPADAAAPDDTLDIHAAAKAGELERAQKMLQSHPELLKARTKLGDTPLHWAASCGHAPLVKLLLSLKAEVDARNISRTTPLHLAAQMAHIESVELLLAAQADVNARDDRDDTPLHMAVRKGDRKTAEMLLNSKADPNAKMNTGVTPMDIALKSAKSELPKLLRKHGGRSDADGE